jgi:D-aminopeptidase
MPRSTGAYGKDKAVPLKMVPNDKLNPLFEATVQSVEEAIINALVAAEAMVGIDGQTFEALDHKRLQTALKKYNRFAPPAMK